MGHVFLSFFLLYFGHTMQLLGSHFPGQGLNLGHISDVESWPLGHQGTPTFSCLVLTVVPLFHKRVLSALFCRRQYWGWVISQLLSARAKVKVCTMICWALNSASETKSLEVHGKNLLLSMFHNKPWHRSQGGEYPLYAQMYYVALFLKTKNLCYLNV